MIYEITHVDPKINKLQVKYTNSLSQEVFLVFIVEDYSEEYLMNTARQGISRAITYFNDLNSKTTLEVDLSTFSSLQGESSAETIVEDELPGNFNEFTQKAYKEYQEIDGVIRGVWVVSDLTDEEIAAVLSEWRNRTAVTMRQARLALSRQGLLAQVQTGINSLSEESQIEWEYAGSVERSSPLVQSLGAALGLSDEDLDNLFKLATTL